MDDNKTVGNYAYLAFDEGWWRIDNVFTPGLIVDEFLVSGQEVTPGIVVGVILLMLRERKIKLHNIKDIRLNGNG